MLLCFSATLAEDSLSRKSIRKTEVVWCKQIAYMFHGMNSICVIEQTWRGVSLPGGETSYTSLDGVSSERIFRRSLVDPRKGTFRRSLVDHQKGPLGDLWWIIRRDLSAIFGGSSEGIFRRSLVDPRKGVFRRSLVDPRKGVFSMLLCFSATLADDSLSRKSIRKNGSCTCNKIQRSVLYDSCWENSMYIL